MVIHEDGQNKITTLIATSFDQGQYGTDDTLESVTDTGLIAPVASSDKPLSGLVSGNSFQLIHDLEAADANDVTLQEFTVKIDGDSVNRLTTFPIEKTVRKEVTTSVNWAIRYN